MGLFSRKKKEEKSAAGCGGASCAADSRLQAEPGKVEPAQAETETVAVEGAKAGTAKTEAEPVKAEGAKAGTAKTEAEPVKAEGAKAGATKTEAEPVKAEGAKAGTAKTEAEPIKAEGAKAGTTKAEPAAAESISVQVLGAGCAKCNALEAAAKEALSRLGLVASVEHVSDFARIAAYGVMTTPALVVDGKVVAMGKVLKAEEIMKLLSKDK